MTTTDATSPTSDSITPTELAARLGDPNLTIVDVRSSAAYNGWRLRGERRGGHIPGAVSFPVAWLRSEDAPEVDRQLADKGVTTDRSIVALRR